LRSLHLKTAAGDSLTIAGGTVADVGSEVVERGRRPVFRAGFVEGEDPEFIPSPEVESRLRSYVRILPM
jgi:hypothetical protein